MPLGVVDDKEFELELARATAQHVDIMRGRGAVREIPEVIRETIAEEKIIGGRATDIAEAFGVSESSVGAYAHGATSTASYNDPDANLQKRNDEVRTKIIGTARKRLFLALREITPEKLREAKLRDVASVAKDMSAIIHNTEPQVSNTNVGAQFIFHVPRARKESEFEIIEHSA